MSPTPPSLNFTLLCELSAPTGPATEPYISIQLAIFILAAVFLFSTSVFYLHMSSRRRRLKVRSMNSITFGSMGTAAILLFRAHYGMQGRDGLPCNSDLAMVYMFALFNIGIDYSEAACFVSKRHLRQVHINAQMKALAVDVTSPAATKKRQVQTNIAAMVMSTTGRPLSTSLDSESLVRQSHVSPLQTASPQQQQQQQKESRWICAKWWPNAVATPLEWFKGFWNLAVTNHRLATNFSDDWKTLKTPYTLRKGLRVSYFRELSYDYCMWTIWSMVFYVVVTVCALVIPRYTAEAMCMGCQLDAMDVGIYFASIAFFLLTTVAVIARMQWEDDPFLVFADLRFLMGVFIVMSIFTYTLVAVDPDGLMHSQQVDWHILEAFTAVALHVRRCIFPMVRAYRIHRKPQLPLLAILNHPQMSRMFELYLTRELATESLLFWKEAVKYKLGFEADFDYSQQLAKMIQRQFIGKRAQLEINISEDQVDNLMARFRSGFVGKTVFDEAMIEVFYLMEKGPYQRFLHSKEFLSYAKRGADFTMNQVAPMNMDAVVNETTTNGRMETSRGGGAATDVSSDEYKLPVAEWLRKL